MKIQTFKTTEEANVFIDTVEVSDLQYAEGTIVVFYCEYKTPESVKAEKIATDERNAMENVVKQEMHLELLTEMKKVHLEAKQPEKVKEVMKGIDQTAKSLNSWKAQMAVIEDWKSA